MPQGDYVIWGLVAGFAALAVASGLRPLRGDVAAPATLLGAIALWWAHGALYDARPHLLVGAAVLAGAAHLPRTWARTAGVIVGAAELMRGLPSWWYRRWEAGLALALVIVVPTAAHSTRRLGQTTTFVMLAATTAGIYAGPPDTEATTIIAAMVGACAAWLLWCGGLRSLDGNPAATAGLAALILVTAMFAPLGRIAAFPGSVACFGVLLVQPVADVITTRSLRPPPATRLDLQSIAARIAIHLGAVFVGSRVAALRHDVTESVVIGAAGTLAALGALVALQLYEGRRLASSSS